MLLPTLVLAEPTHGPSHDTRSRVYRDAAGRPLGRSRTTGNTTRYFDEAGRPLGSSRARGNTETYFDAAGRRLGTSRGR